MNTVPEISDTFATLRVMRVRCGPTDHAFSFAVGALSGDRIFCAKCGQVRLLLTDEELETRDGEDA